MARLPKIVPLPQPDDVEALCSTAEINSIGYKRFASTMKLQPDVSATATALPLGREPPEQAKAENNSRSLRLDLREELRLFREQARAGNSSQTPVVTIAADAAPAVSPMRLSELGPFPQCSPATPCFHAVSASQPPHPPSMRVEPPIVPADRESPRILRDCRKTSRVALERVFEQNLEAYPNARQSKRVRQLIPFYSAGGGGVGVTTIMGTLARYFACQGERVLLIDGAPRSTLGFFFNGAVSPEGVSSFAPDSLTGNEAQSRGQVDISCRPASPADSLQGTDPEGWAWQSIAQLGAEADRVFVDVHQGVVVTDRSQLRLVAEGNPLVIIAPDVRCVLGIRRLMSMFKAEEPALGRSVVPSFLLNLFDSGDPFHVEILNGLRKLLGDQLLPMVIPRTVEISEIAVEGMTIIDFNRGSPAAESFRHLAEWIQDQPAVEPIGRLGPDRSR